jgi:DNA polymerase III delta prime subunit
VHETGSAPGQPAQTDRRNPFASATRVPGMPEGRGFNTRYSGDRVWEPIAMRSELLLLGGRSGVGKTTAALALHEILKADGLTHAVIEGDYLDLAEPAPHVAHPLARLAERNLAAMWANYRELGYRRLILTNTASVLYAAELAEAMGDDPRVVAVLLHADDISTRARLGTRLIDRDLDAATAASAGTAARLEADASEEVHRVNTNGRLPADVASELRDLAGWTPQDDARG